MFNNRLILSAALVGLMLAGCDEPRHAAVPAQAAPAVAQAPATRPAEDASRADAAPAVARGEHATTRPAVATSSFRVFETSSNFDPGVLYEFPVARLHINKDDNTAVLYSDDPKSAIDPNYKGNSYYLVIPLDKDNPGKLNGYHYAFRAASSSEHQDSSDGVFLEGQRIHLQPSDINIYLAGDGPVVKLAVMGQFLRFDTASDQTAHVGTPVNLKGVVNAKLDPSDK